MLRLTGGRFKGHPILVPSHLKTRPTLSKLRQALFNSIQTRIEDARVLDLFAGSGALGFEALSRGASQLVSVEKDRKTSRLIEKNAAQLQVESQVRVLSLAVEKSWSALIAQAPFDLVLADPPYEKGWEQKILEAAPWDQLLNPEALICIESSKKSAFLPEKLQKLVKIREKIYGDTVLTTLLYRP